MCFVHRRISFVTDGESRSSPTDGLVCKQVQPLQRTDQTLWAPGRCCLKTPKKKTSSPDVWEERWAVTFWSTLCYLCCCEGRAAGSYMTVPAYMREIYRFMTPVRIAYKEPRCIYNLVLPQRQRWCVFTSCSYMSWPISGSLSRCRNCLLMFSHDMNPFFWGGFFLFKSRTAYMCVHITAKKNVNQLKIFPFSFVWISINVHSILKHNIWSRYTGHIQIPERSSFIVLDWADVGHFLIVLYCLNKTVYSYV